MQRRKFIKSAALTSAGLAVTNSLLSCEDTSKKENSTTPISTTQKASLPLVIATWHVENATAKAMEVLQSGGNALDARGRTSI